MATKSKANISAHFRTMADTLTAEIERKFADRAENTPKRQRQAKSQRIEGDHLTRLQRALRVLADAHEDNRCPDILKDIKTKSELFDMLKTRIGSSGYYEVHDTGEYYDQSEQAQTLRLLMDSMLTHEEQANIGETARLAKIKDAEARLRFADIDGFWPTPKKVAESLLAGVYLPEFGQVLEPSAGIGSILEVVHSKWPTANMVYCERNASLCEVLDMKGFRGLQGDFLEQEPSPVIDLVVMNPPFENGQDAEHIRRAYEWLRPNGTLIAVASAAVLHNTRNKYATFREWLSSVNALIDEIPDGSFAGKDSFKQTDVSTIRIEIVNG